MRDHLAVAISAITLLVMLLGGSYTYGRVVERLDYSIMVQAQHATYHRETDGALEKRVTVLEVKAED